MSIRLIFEFFQPNYSFLYLALRKKAVKKIFTTLFDFQKYEVPHYSHSFYLKLVFVDIYLQIE